MAPENDRQFNDNIALVLMLLSGSMVLVAGIYFKINNLTSSGLQMDEFGNSSLAGTINGDGMIFFGVLFCTIYAIIKYKKKSQKS